MMGEGGGQGIMALLYGGGGDSTISYRLILMVYFPKDIISYPVFLLAYSKVGDGGGN